MAKTRPVGAFRKASLSYLQRALQADSMDAIAPLLLKQAGDRPYDAPENFEDFAAQCQIRSGSEYIPFNLYDYQVELSNIIDRHRRISVFKTRQLGASEVIACKMFQRCCRNPGYLGTVLSMGQDESSKIAQRVQGMPTFPGFAWSAKSTTHVSPVGGGTMLFRPSTDNAVRSLPSVTDLFFDEAAFIARIEELYAGATPSQKMAGADAKTYVVSTMDEGGELGWFWNFFASDTPSNIDIDQAIAHIQEGKGECGAGMTWWVDDAGWAKILLHWKSHPIYCDIPDYLARTKLEEKLTESKLQREYNLGIPKSGGALFGKEAIALAAIGQWAPAWKYDPYKPNERSRKYLAGIDPNFGGGDYYRCQIWDITQLPASLVAEYAENERSMEYSHNKVVELLKAYKPVLTAVESNSGGVAVLEGLVKVLPSMRFEQVNTSHTSKRVNTDRIAIALECNEVIFPPDWDGIDEMKRFSVRDRCATTGHDDAVMCWAIAWAHYDLALTLSATATWGQSGAIYG